ncbi:cytidylyltransferase family protein [archaeon BMS3Bbin15]|nr:cytidylyltransferase family protein [archaeon BMS3Bbin15]
MEEFEFTRELKRQSVHISGSLLAAVYILMGESYALALSMLGLITTMFIYLSYRKNRHVFRFLITSLERNMEKSVARGAVFYFSGIILTILLFPPYIIPAVIIITTFGDAFSTLVGLKFGSIKLPYNRIKSVQGSLAFLVSAFLASSLVIPTELAFAGSLTGALVESLINRRDEDNILVPLFTGLTLKLLLCSGIL